MNTTRADGGRRVVVTGMGWLSPAGCTLLEGWNQLLNGICCLSPSGETFDQTPVRVLGWLKGFDPLLHMDKKTARRTDPFIQYALAAGSMAMLDAGYDGKVPDPDVFGAVVASGAAGITWTMREHTVLCEKGYKRVNSLLMPGSIANMGCAQLSVKYDLRGPCTTQNTACATGNHVLGDGFRAIKHGYADAMLCGSSDAALNPLTLAGFSGLQALSTSDDPLCASLPFDARREGFVAGEGAGALVLESLERAKRRGARIYAEVLGFGSTADAYHMTAPHPEGRGSARAMQLAMREGGVSSDQIDYLNAHGTGTPLGDRCETLAIRKALGSAADQVAVSSIKGSVGHMLAAAASVESIACVLALYYGMLPPNAGYEQPDPDCNLNIIHGAPRECCARYVLNNALGFGGHNGAVLFGALE